jgi:DNA-binding transcriptional MerR regulator
MPVNLTRFPELRQAEIKALLEQGYSLKKISQMAKCSLETVIAVKRSNKFDRAIVDAIKDKISGKFYRVADAAVDAITPEKLENATPVQLITTAGIAIDKARLIDGDSTARVEFVGVNDAALEEEIMQLQTELDGWKQGSTVNAELVDGSVDATQATQSGLSPNV